MNSTANLDDLNCDNFVLGAMNMSFASGIEHNINSEEEGILLHNILRVNQTFM